MINIQVPNWELKDQSKESVARITGVSESDLTLPFYAYIPLGWFALAGILLVVNLISGPSPKKRFAKLTRDDDYVQSLKIMIEPDEFVGDEPVGDEDVSDHDGVELEATSQLRFETAVSYLMSQGISEAKAQRNLQFLIGYLRSHPNAMIP